jgi:uncharacterized protein (DUF2267 family)
MGDGGAGDNVSPAMDQNQETAAGGGGSAGDEPDDLFRQVEQEVTLPGHVTGEDAVSAVMCVLTQRISGGEARDVAESLPGRARRLLQRCPRHHLERPDVFGLAGFIERVGRHLKVSNGEAEAVTRAVFAVARQWLPPKEVADIASQLPSDLRALWASPADLPLITVPPPDADRRTPPNELAMKVLADVHRSGVVPPGKTEQDVISAVLCVLSQRLSGGEARHLLVTLPPALQPLVQKCALHPERGEKFGLGEFLERVAQHLGIKPEEADSLVRTVFTAVAAAIKPKEVRDIASQLPIDLKRVWTASAAAAGVPSPSG